MLRLLFDIDPDDYDVGPEEDVGAVVDATWFPDDDDDLGPDDPGPSFELLDSEGLEPIEETLDERVARVVARIIEVADGGVDFLEEADGEDDAEFEGIDDIPDEDAWAETPTREEILQRWRESKARKRRQARRRRVRRWVPLLALLVAVAVAC